VSVSATATEAAAVPRSPLDGSPYQAYAYSYPHKTSYRPLDPPVALDELWAAERRDALFLYVHVPFCGMRCGFCNLFTRAGADGATVARYLDALRRQAGRVREALGEAAFARFAIGGGTPTYLDLDGLEAVLDVAERIMGLDVAAIPASVEVSPGTVDADKLALLVGRGVDRISIGVETFDEAEAVAVYRPQEAAAVERALGLIRDAGPRTLNIDLIYGLPGQTVASWLRSVGEALRHAPEELYLYPLYVRPLTGLGRSGRSWDDLRTACYREARDLLAGCGYEQVSMRMFRRPGTCDAAGVVYCCQDDGMVGLGCGARSYTRGLHYSTEYAVGAHGVRALIEAYSARPAASFGVAGYGRRLDGEDQRRRFVIQSLLQCAGLSLAAYTLRFGTAAGDDLPELSTLEDLGLAERRGDVLRLTAAGIERSDAIGPWLYSDGVRRAMEAYQWR
jgi:oxygen-independent coproporphyrinogen-3 oxidase